MKKNKLQQLGVLLVIMILSVNLSFAQNNPPPPPQGPMFETMIPDLTDEQSAEIEELRLEKSNTITPLEADLGIKQAELKALLASDSQLNEKEAKIKEITDIQFKIEVARVTFHHNVRDLLDDNQKTSFDRWTLNRNHRQGSRMQHKGNGQNNCNGYHKGNGQNNGNGPHKGNRQGRRNNR